MFSCRTNLFTHKSNVKKISEPCNSPWYTRNFGKRRHNSFTKSLHILHIYKQTTKQISKRASQQDSRSEMNSCLLKYKQISHSFHLCTDIAACIITRARKQCQEYKESCSVHFCSLNCAIFSSSSSVIRLSFSIPFKLYFLAHFLEPSLVYHSYRIFWNFPQFIIHIVFTQRDYRPPPGGGYLTNFNGPTPYPYIYHFGRKGTPFIYLLLKKGTPFTYLIQEVLFSFSCSP